MSAWSHLPNAKHIDWVIASVEQYPGIWAATRGAARVETWFGAWSVARYAAYNVTIDDAARDAIWDAARDAAWDAACGAAWNEARAATRDAIWDATRDAAWEAACGAALDATRGAARDAIWDAIWDATRDAILALISYDDCANLFDMSGDQLKTWAVLSEQPAAVLLLSAVEARERIAQLERA